MAQDSGDPGGSGPNRPYFDSTASLCVAYERDNRAGRKEQIFTALARPEQDRVLRKATGSRFLGNCGEFPGREDFPEWNYPSRFRSHAHNISKI